MGKIFESADSKVLLVEPNSSLRAAYGRAISEIGVRNITTCADLRAALEVLEVERFDWVVTRPAIKGDTVSGIHLLKLCCKIPALRDTRISFLIEDEYSLLPDAYELGLMSHLPLCENVFDAQKHFGAF